MMLRIFGALLLIGAAIFVIKVAVVILVIAGLIFRTKETIGVLLFFGILNLLNAHPVIGITLLCGVGFFAILNPTKKGS